MFFSCSEQIISPRGLVHLLCLPWIDSQKKMKWGVVNLLSTAVIVAHVHMQHTVCSSNPNPTPETVGIVASGLPFSINILESTLLRQSYLAPTYEEPSGAGPASLYPTSTCQLCFFFFVAVRCFLCSLINLRCMEQGEEGWQIKTTPYHTICYQRKNIEIISNFRNSKCQPLRIFLNVSISENVRC